MFERLTRWENNDKDVAGLIEGKSDFDGLTEAVTRLAEYEDSELSPEEVQELAKAKADGRLVVLPETGIGDLSDGYHTFNELYHHLGKLNTQPENSRQHALQTGVCPMCEDCPDGCPVETPKDSRNIVTNADRIRSMNDEELARFLGDEPPHGTAE